MPIIVPDEAKQREFARAVYFVDEQRQRYRMSLAEFDRLFASLQHRAFRGEL